MSQTETWRRAALMETEAQRKRMKSVAESQHQLAEQIELIAESLKLLSEENRQSQRQFLDTSAEIWKQMRDQITDTQAAASSAQRAAASIQKAANQAVETLRKEAKILSWQTLAWTFLGGLMAGMTLLSVLAIWQPKLLSVAWMAAQILGTAPAQ